ncbi:GDSL-type esterase/lipase family protein [Catenulispora pinisilvae]|uniref:GDSL-type esterase/lipase family protein n=1 Tax=Catenulispora pinisilvae TaxID=2705253 RepID=UPI0018923B96|nr:GDSL-type esterase/lipase family protein [Catenulispora pinisilvae]
MTDALRPVPLSDGPVAIRGALELVATEAGVLPRRLPEWTIAQSDASMERQATSGSGVRLAFRSAAKTLELDVLTTVPMMAENEPHPDDAGLFDITVDGVPGEPQRAPVGTVILLDDTMAERGIVPGKPSTVRFEGLPAGVKDVEIWLPQWVKTELVALRADAAVEPPTPTGHRTWLHHGSSISQCNEADSPLGVWPVIAARAAHVDPVNVGLSGNCYLDPFVARSIRDTPADLISLKLGINFTAKAAFVLRSLVPTIHGFLDTIREGHPDTPLLVISPIACPALEQTPGPTLWRDGVLHATGNPATAATGALTLQAVRRELARIVTERAKQDPNIHYLDGLALVGLDEADEYLAEGLHPSPAGYRVIGERFARLAFGAGGAFAG